MSDLDAAALEGWMGRHVDGFAGPVDVTRFSGGQSNPTYRLATPGRDYVLRRRPGGPLLSGAHRIDREARVMTALGGEGFPVPTVHALCEDDGVVGSAFYVMDMVPGRIFWDGGLPGLAREERAACYDAMNATIAALHGFAPDAIGLGDYGRPAGYLARQIALWSRQYREDTEAGRSDDMDMLAEWLPAHVPEGDEVAVVHGDFRIDNLIFAADAPRVAAVLDWELSTLGHPLVDFAYHLMMYRVPSIIPWGLADRDLAALGIPSEAEYLALYCARTGRDAIPDLDFFLAFNLFRFAAIVHGIKGRMARGNAASAEAGALVRHLDLFAALARELAEKG